MLKSPLNEELRAHIANRPKPPKLRSFILCDVTPEAIAWHLHTVHRSAGLMSDEGGQILNGRSADQLPMLNVLWDGGDLKVSRKDSESFTVRNARFSISIMIQHRTFRKFMDRRGELARDNGFLARALICAPPSIQGQRPITSIEIAKFPMLEIFQRRLTELLKETKCS